jgi:NADPH:quinone reductase-like Zn-dependent oxidoreductase
LRPPRTSLGTAEDFRAVLDAVETGKIRPLLARTFPLSDIREAHAFFKAKEFFGKLAVVPQHEA